MLDTNDLAVLKRAFSFNDHEFTRGFVYLTEDSISNRIEEVDPSWSFEVLNLTHEGNNAICHARLTIKDVAREGVGMQQIMEKAGEPAKGAATDALKRCARLFGVGRYLLNAPKEGDAFKKWLADEQKKSIDLTTGEKVAGEIRPTPTPSPAPTPPMRDTAGVSPEQVVVDGAPQDAIDRVFPKPENSIVVREVEVKTAKSGKPYLIFREGDVRVTAFTREPLREVLTAEQVAALGQAGKHTVPPMRLYWKAEGDYLSIEKAELIAS